MRERRFWTEQYLLRAFLAFNKSFEIIWAFGIMESERPNKLIFHFPYVPIGTRYGGSPWRRRIA
jgi:hypothetical protein